MAPDDGAALKLRAEDCDDLAVISACLQDALVPVRDLAYDRVEHTFHAGRQPLPLGRQAALGGRRGRAIERTLAAITFERGGRASPIAAFAAAKTSASCRCWRSTRADEPGHDPISNFPAARQSGWMRRASSATRAISASPGRPPWQPAPRAGERMTRANPASPRQLIMALPNGRILGEVMPLLRQIGIEPEPAFDDPASRQLRFATIEPAASTDPGAQLRRRDLCRFRRRAARRRRQRRADGIRLFRNLCAARPRYRALPDGGRGAGRLARAGGRADARAICASRPNIPRSPAAISPRAASRPNASS